MRKTRSVRLKAEVDDSGHVVGYASTWTREPDSYGDVVARGAFADCIERIKADGTTLPLLYNHDQWDIDNFIGTVTSLEEDEHGLRFEADFDETPRAQRARELVKDGRLCKVSFAYDVLDMGSVTLDDGRTANELRKLDIFEVSLVFVPANPDTSIVEAKGLSARDLSTVTKAISDAARRGMELGAKAGRRNSKADEESLRDALGHAEALEEILRSLIEEEGSGDGDDGSGANGAGGSAKGGEGAGAPKGREAGTDDLEAYRAALVSAYDNDCE